MTSTVNKMQVPTIAVLLFVVHFALGSSDEYTLAPHGDGPHYETASLQTGIGMDLSSSYG